jgi:hypothetical protein
MKKIEVLKKLILMMISEKIFWLQKYFLIFSKENDEFLKK